MARVELRDLLDAKRWGEAVARRADLDLLDRGRRVRGGAGAVGLRQIDHALHARGIYSRPAARSASTARAVNDVEAQRPQRRHRLPVLCALSAHDGAPEHYVPLALQARSTKRGRAPRARSPRLVRIDGCSTGGPASFRAASSNGSRSPARWSSSRNCSCSTSRCPTSTPRCASRCAARSGASSAAPASRRSSSPTTRSRRRPWPTGSSA